MSQAPQNPQAVQGITEADIAQFLAHTPGFFERHAELLSSVQLTSPHGQRAVSLQERQVEMLRERIKGLELKLMQMIRHGQDNEAIADRLHRWTRAIMTAASSDLPEVVVAELRHQFMVPQAAIRLWDVTDAYSVLPAAAPVSEDAKILARSLTVPYCGVNAGFEAAGWLGDAQAVASVALIPLQHHAAETPVPSTFGLLVLASPDPTRYTADMGTEFLQRVGDIASAGLSRLIAVRAE